MTRILANAIVALTLGAGIMVVSTQVDAAPSYGLTVGSGQVNPFSAVDGR